MRLAGRLLLFKGQVHYLRKLKKKKIYSFSALYQGRSRPKGMARSPVCVVWRRGSAAAADLV